jgi:hypothetical protein
MRWSKKGESVNSAKQRQSSQQLQRVPTMDNIAAMSSAEARKLDLGIVVEKDNMKDSEDNSVHEIDTHGLLIGQQYILDRPDSEGGPQV